MSNCICSWAEKIIKTDNFSLIYCFGYAGAMTWGLQVLPCHLQRIFETQTMELTILRLYMLSMLQNSVSLTSCALRGVSGMGVVGGGLDSFGWVSRQYAIVIELLKQRLCAVSSWETSNLQSRILESRNCTYTQINFLVLGTYQQIVCITQVMNSIGIKIM